MQYLEMTLTRIDGLAPNWKYTLSGALGVEGA